MTGQPFISEAMRQELVDRGWTYAAEGAQIIARKGWTPPEEKTRDPHAFVSSVEREKTRMARAFTAAVLAGPVWDPSTGRVEPRNH